MWRRRGTTKHAGLLLPLLARPSPPDGALPAALPTALQVRCYEVQSNGTSAARAAFAHDAPALCCAWHSDGGSVFSAGCDKQAKRWDLGSNAQVQVAAHDAPVRHLAWVPELALLVTGSWDRTLRFWDLRSPTASHTHPLPERCYALSVAHPLLVVATADRHIQVIDLANPSRVYKQLASPLKYQTRSVAAFPDKTGFLVGSIEGRVAVHHVEEAASSKNFTFKCHRDGDAIHAVRTLFAVPMMYGGRAAAPSRCLTTRPSPPPRARAPGERVRVPPGTRHVCDGGQRRVLQLLGQGLEAAAEGDAPRPGAHPVRRVQRGRQRAGVRGVVRLEPRGGGAQRGHRDQRNLPARYAGGGLQATPARARRGAGRQAVTGARGGGGGGGAGRGSRLRAWVWVGRG